MAKKNLDIIMLSNFDINGGGRETWIYNFVPKLLEGDLVNSLHIFGYKLKTEKPYHKDFQKKTSAIDSEAMNLEMIEGGYNRLPRFMKMFLGLHKYSQTKNREVDVVLVMGILELMMLVTLKRYKKSKKVVWLRSIFIHEKAYRISPSFRKLFLKFELFLLKQVDLVISNGDDIRDFYKEYGIDIHVIKNGVDLEKWNIGTPPLSTPIKIAYIGRLSQVKGIESYFELVERVKAGDLGDNFEFHCVGNESAYSEEVLKLTQKKWLINHGMIPNDQLPEFLKDIDVCVALTYSSENGGGGGTSNAMLEQLAASRILLAWDNKIFEQYLSNDNSYLAKQYSISDLEKSLYQILNDKEKALQKSKYGYNTVIPYTYNANVEKFIKLIKF